MKIIKTSLLATLLITLSGCASNGEHIYVDGKCISCWNNPLTNETLNYEKAGANNYTQLSWRDMMLEGLSQNNVKNLTPYGEDYLKHKIGNKAYSLKNNDITYQREINKSIAALDRDLKKHSLKKAYQATASSKLGKYDFAKQEFPIRLTKSFILSGGNNITNLPGEITVNIENLADIPNLKISPKEAEEFLKSRNNSKSLYVRYILEINKMITPSSFIARVKEIQFIDVKPSMVTKNKKESYQPFKAIKI